MARSPKAGWGTCPSCGHQVMFRRSAKSGALSYACDECDSSGFASQGSASDERWSATIGAAKAAPAPGPDQAKAQAPAPGPAAPAQREKPRQAKAGGFTLGEL